MPVQSASPISKIVHDNIVGQKYPCVYCRWIPISTIFSLAQGFSFPLALSSSPYLYPPRGKQKQHRDKPMANNKDMQQERQIYHWTVEFPAIV